LAVKIERLYRYPIKGLTGQRLDAVTISKDGPMPYDRVFAIAHGATDFDDQAPRFLRKQNFLVLMQNPEMAAIKVTYFTEPGQVTMRFPDGESFSGNLYKSSDRCRAESMIAGHVGERSRGGPPRIVYADAHRFFDNEKRFLSIINLESVNALSAAVGEYLDPLRFRANVYVSGLAAWSEADLVGKRLRCGSSGLHVAEATTRCSATSVNPVTANVDINVPYSLRKHYGTLAIGVYATVEEAGRLATEDVFEVVES
jgi:hypothetical protein